MKSDTLRDRLFIASQYLLPHHLLSRLAGRLADCQVRWLKNLAIRLFVRHYQVNLQEALTEEPGGYASFNEFFARPLKAEARPLAAAPAILSPCDGAISQLGRIEQGRIFQAKGHNFGLIDLLGGDHRLASPFMGGQFATLYLSPRDYHRIHMPVAGTLRQMIHVPGRLFSVNPLTTRQVPELFARNERVICLFDTALGPMALVLVGAMIVASIETVWAGRVTPLRREVRSIRYDEQARAAIQLERGEEMGRFRLGSTVIVLFGTDCMQWASALASGQTVRQGGALGQPPG